MKIFDLSLFVLFGFLRLAANSAVDTTLYYALKPIPKKDRTELEITLKFYIKRDTAMAVKLFGNYYGSADIYK